MSDANTASEAARRAAPWAVRWAATRAGPPTVAQAATRAATQVAPPIGAPSMHVEWCNKVAAAAAASGRLTLCRRPTRAGRAGGASLPVWFGNGDRP